MGYKKFTDLADAAEIMDKIRDVLLEEGWTILTNNILDTAVDGSGDNDGLRLAVKSPDSTIFATFRSANGKKIFNTQINETNSYGIGLTCHDGYTENPPSGKWYDQPNVPVVFDTEEVIGVGIPVKPNGSHAMYINVLHDPAHMVIISVESNGVFQHLAVGNLEKTGDWDGGAVFSGSRNSYNMFTQSPTFEMDVLELESTPLFGMADEACTFLRIDIDGAPTRLPPVLWADSGNPDIKINHCCTGKQLALPVRELSVAKANWIPKVPDYTKLQSQTTTDSGRNINTLNCISVNEPQTAYILRDPNELRNFSPCGYLPGIYFISLKSVAAGQVYNINYPESGNLHQTFPFTRRKGRFGYDGFSIKQ